MKQMGVQIYSSWHVFHAKPGGSSWTLQPYSARIWCAPPEDKQAKGISASIRARTSGSSARSAARPSPQRKAQPGRVGTAHLTNWPATNGGLIPLPPPLRMVGHAHPTNQQWWAMPTLRINNGGPCPPYSMGLLTKCSIIFKCHIIAPIGGINAGTHPRKIGDKPEWH